MTWVRIHDGALGHPKLTKIFQPKDAFDLWVWGLSYVQTHLTDGVIPRQSLPQAPKSTVMRLVELRLWDTHPDGYLVHNYLKWNDSAEVVVDKREKAKERMRNVRRNKHSERVQENKQGSSEWSGSFGVQDLPAVPISPQSLEWFDRVYAAYPQKARKEKANRAWIALNPSPEMAQAILRDITRRVEAGWVRLEGRFIPHLSTYLEDAMWRDAPPVDPIYEDTENLPHAWHCKQCGEVHEGTSKQAKERVCLTKSGLT